MCPTNVIQILADVTKFDTVNLSVLPVILVPGVMGSRFTVSSGVSWDPDSSLPMLSLIATRQRKLANALDASNPASIIVPIGSTGTSDVNNSFVDTDPEIAAFSKTLPGGGPPPIGQRGSRVPQRAATIFFAQQRGWGGVSWDFYGKLLIELETKLKSFGRYPVHAVGYDWRQSNSVSGAALLQAISAILKQHNAQKVLIVTHSMGGLVTRSALQQGAMSLVEGVVHCVMPAHGAVVQYRRFHTGATIGLDSLKPSQTTPNSVIDKALAFDPPGFFLTQILGVTPFEYAITQAGLPGPLQLLPTNEYPGVFISFPANLSVPQGTSPPPPRQANAPNAVQSLGDVYNVYLQNQIPGIVPAVGASESPSIVFVPLPPAFVPTPIPIPGVTILRGDVSKLRTNIAAAKVFHATIVTTVHKKTAMLFGDQITTDAQVAWTVPAVLDPNAGGEGSGSVSPPPPTPALTVVKAPAGDGTVPALSARFALASGNFFKKRSPCCTPSASRIKISLMRSCVNFCFFQAFLREPPRKPCVSHSLPSPRVASGTSDCCRPILYSLRAQPSHCSFSIPG